jgi:integrative and conjugative element protein (TIGR02256 family)
MAAYLASADHDDARLLECRRRPADGVETVVFEVRAERPQELKADIRRWEQVAAVFTGNDDRQPIILAAREDFPETPHQNAIPAGHMRYPCVDDRPWSEAQSTWTPLSFLERIRWWLGAAASGTLSDEVQAVDPLFVSSGPDVAIPRAFLQPGCRTEDMVLFSGAGPGRPKLYHLVPGAPRGGSSKALRVVPIRLAAQTTRALRSAPQDLAELIAALGEFGGDMLSPLREAALDILKQPHNDPAMVAVLVIAPIKRADGGLVAMEDAKVFGIPLSLGELGERLGVLDKNPGYDASAKGNGSPYGRCLPPGDPDRLEEIGILVMPVHAEFDRELARECAGLAAPDTRKAVLVGAGAVGSHLAMALAREGSFRWIIVDDDHLLPHNLARHTLGRPEVGAMKAEALAAQVAHILGDRDAARGLACNVLFPGEAASELETAISDAEVVIDASASVAVGRKLSDADGTARRASVFLNPAGTAAVLLSEDVARGIRLDALEGQYYRLLLLEPAMATHLSPPPGGLRYTGACRSVSSRIPETSVMVLSGLASRALASALDREDGTIAIWTMDEGGAVAIAKARAMPCRRIELGTWTVTYDEGLLGRIKAARDAALPAETGGVLVGIVDVARKAIVVVHALEPPPDSVGTPDQFERGVSGLLEHLRHVQAVTRDQVRYAGEWHSHPRGHSGFPSHTDIAQVLALRAELGRENIPPIMMILGEPGEVVVSAGMATDEPSTESRENGRE